MKYITLFNTTADFEAAQSTLDKPNVSLVEATQNISYLPYVAPETRVIIKYNVTDTEEDTPLCADYYKDNMAGMEIDGVAQNNVVSTYRFDTTGEHIVKATLPDDEDIIPSWIFSYTDSITEVIIPSTVTLIGGGAFYGCSNLSKITCNAMVAPTLSVDQSCNAIGHIAATGTLYVPTGSTGYDAWMTVLGNGWTKVEQ